MKNKARICCNVLPRTKDLLDAEAVRSSSSIGAVIDELSKILEDAKHIPGPDQDPQLGLCRGRATLDVYQIAKGLRDMSQLLRDKVKAQTTRLRELGDDRS